MSGDRIDRYEVIALLGSGGKVIVLPSTTALKFGRFVGYLPTRMLQNYDHFHRRPGDGPVRRIYFRTC